MKLILRFIKPYRWLYAITIFAVGLDVIGALLIPTITADMINIGVSSGNVEQILQKGLLLLGISILTGFSALLGSWFCAKLSARMSRDMRNAIYHQSLTFSSSDFERFGTASMITRTLNDVNMVQQALVMLIQMVLPVPIICVLGVIFAFRIHSGMGFVLFVAILFLLIVSTIIVKNAAPMMKKIQRFLDRMNVVLRENITGVRVVRAFNKEEHEVGRMKKTFSEYADAAIKVHRLFATLDSFSVVVVNFCMVAILYFGGNFVGSGTMSIGDILAVTEYTIWILYYIIMAQMVLVLMPRAFVCLQRISQVLSHTPEIVDGTEKGALSPKDRSEVVRLEHVTFRFMNADEDTLSHLSFALRRGETTAIIGGTGSGKSTIAKLLLRYHDVSAGKIMLHNVDIRDLTQTTLREHISYVPQKAWLFSGTIADNLKYGHPNATETEMYRALHVAQSDFVRTLPHGLDTYVAQGGANFSGGQKQRLSIARALCKKADLYVFDDSFSALDFKTDAALRHALAEEVQDAAILIIAQRISTIVHAHQIIVLDDGKVAGIGTHTYLLEKCPLYRDIAESQMKGGDFHGK
ncbi:MAG: ABC transporter ATP-binding protein [Planctomycetia bacterium]|nr:ABC transporter ATP-binding protein [Planctomycetia bacterium]